jgi:branched-chain amino acid transport system substrate-binding protein
MLKANEIRVELLVLDDASKTETAVAQAQRATTDSAVVLAIAHFNSPCALATVGIFHETGMPVIVPAAVNSKITQDNFREVVRTCNTDIDQAHYVAKYLIDSSGAKRIYAVHDSSAFGKGLVLALKKELETRGHQFDGLDAFHVGDVDFSSILARIVKSGPDAVVIGCMATEGALFRKQMVEKRIAIPLIGFSGIFYDTFIQNAGEDAEGTMAIFPLPPLNEIPGGQQFFTAYNAVGYNEPFESAGPFGYVAGQVAVQTLSSGAVTRSAIIEYLHNNTFNTAFGNLRFDERGEMTLKMFCFYVVRDGKWIVTQRVTESGDVVPVTP